ncbi:squamosa promoter-binding-like protein 6 [Sesamum indicum]|uniref:Squamosa promoter-binding-like protein 6 n=1 Tax=Sesamum indicum TaxID=4182 RepID=A0A6I9T8N8_SESIN|nr:squamosa promoter-binding-like protein 6 [Sesamum indicum]
MESLSYPFEGRGLPFTNDVELHIDGSRNLLKGWDAETGSVPIRDVFEIEGMGFIEPDVVSPQCMENSVDNANGVSGKSVPSTSTITLEFGKRFTNSVVKTNDEKLVESGSMIENLACPRESKGIQFSVENSISPSQGPSVSAKRARIANLQSQIPVCIVYGCNKDLSSSKEYHRRHKVCDVHSKTARVIVNGIQQRFCQQCSRFHVLTEFDDGKRSCRKRLAGHNERRRKPQFDTHFGSTFFGTDLSRTSLLFSKIIPNGFSGDQCNNPTHPSRHVKLEEEPSQTSQSAVPLNVNQVLPKPLLRLHENGKQYPPENLLSSPLSVLELPAGTNSSSALSLLSAQSPNLLSNSGSISSDHPLILEEYHQTNLGLYQNPTKPAGKTQPKNFNPIVFSSSSDDVDQGVSFGTRSRESGLNHYHYPSPSPEGANTVDLLQLSFHLQRVEQQKYSGQVKLENGSFRSPT